MKNNNHTTLKILIIFMINIIVISAVWFVFIYELNNHKKNIIKNYENQQEYAVNQLSDRLHIKMDDYLKSGMTENAAEEKVVSDVIKKETNTNNKYIFFYKNDEALFEKNDKTTLSYKDKSIEKIFMLWSYNGGQNLDNFKNMLIDEISSSCEVQKSNTNIEILSWSFFDEGNDKYVVGMSTSEDYLMQISMFKEHKTIILASLGVFSAFELVISILFSLNIFFSNKKENELKQRIYSLNKEKDNFISEIERLKKLAKTASIYDGVTKVYNRSFFYILLSKMNIDAFNPVAVIRVKINKLSSINNIYGVSKGDIILIKTAEILKDKSGDGSFVSRISDSEFVIIKTNTDINNASQVISEIDIKAREAFNGLVCNLSFGAAVKKYNTDNLLDILELARIR